MFTAILKLPFDHWKLSFFHKFVERQQLSNYDSLSWKHLKQHQIRRDIMWFISLSWPSKITQIWTIHSKSPIPKNDKKFFFKKRRYSLASFLFDQCTHSGHIPGRHAAWTESHTLGAGASLREMSTRMSEPHSCMWESHWIYCLKDQSLWAWKWML